jgi:hypothetical protein
LSIGRLVESLDLMELSSIPKPPASDYGIFWRPLLVPEKHPDSLSTCDFEERFNHRAVFRRIDFNVDTQEE